MIDAEQITSVKDYIQYIENLPVEFSLARGLIPGWMRGSYVVIFYENKLSLFAIRISDFFITSFLRSTSSDCKFINIFVKDEK